MNQHYGSDTWFTACLAIEASSKTFGILRVPKVFFRIPGFRGGQATGWKTGLLEKLNYYTC
ncbi:MAG: hypothetical protein GX036_06845 [Firmicutes bacterium]|nr:hypothetical protein [Bacillota bacterium]